MYLEDARGGSIISDSESRKGECIGRAHVSGRAFRSKLETFTPRAMDPLIGLSVIIKRLRHRVPT